MAQVEERKRETGASVLSKIWLSQYTYIHIIWIHAAHFITQMEAIEILMLMLEQLLPFSLYLLSAITSFTNLKWLLILIHKIRCYCCHCYCCNLITNSRFPHFHCKLRMKNCSNTGNFGHIVFGVSVWAKAFITKIHIEFVVILATTQHNNNNGNTQRQRVTEDNQFKWTKVKLNLLGGLSVNMYKSMTRQMAKWQIISLSLSLFSTQIQFIHKS